MTETGLVSDERYAEERAKALATRGASDRLIRLDLRRQGIPHLDVEHAVAQLESEDARAARVFERRGGSTKALRYLAGKGFSAETLERLGSADQLH